MTMTRKQRILAAARKQPVDKLPVGARIDVWYNYHAGHDTLPDRYQGWSIPDILRDLGAGIELYHPRMWKTEYRNTEVVIHEDPPYTTTEYRTPKGTVRKKTMFTPQEGPWVEYELELLFKSSDDYPAIEYLLENTVLVPDLDEYVKKQEMVGEDGLVLCASGYSPMQEIMRRIMGYERFFFELHDHPSQVEHLYELMKEVVWQRLRILAESTAEIIPACGNWSDDIHTPVFKKYFVPWLQEVAEFMHSKGKLTRVHADGEMKRLIPMFLETGIDVAEAWSPAPMTSVTTAELRKAWGDKVTVWGGVPAMLFEPQYSDKEFDDYVLNLFGEIVPGYNFILGMGDNVAFDGKIERVGRMAELAEKYGRLRIEI